MFLLAIIPLIIKDIFVITLSPKSPLSLSMFTYMKAFFLLLIVHFILKLL